MTARQVTVLAEDHLDLVMSHSAAAFGGDPADEAARERRRGTLARGEIVGLWEDGTLLAVCRLYAVDHHLGGRPVPMQHVGGVAVPPQHRGRGVASEMMRAAVGRGVEEGLGLSLLYPATVALYRRLGWEHAGWYESYEVDARRVPAMEPTMRLADGEGDWAAIRACYDRWAATVPVGMARGEVEWDGYARARYRYALDGSDGLVAYALVDQQHDPGDWQHVLELRDWVARTPDGLAAVVGLAGSGGTLARAVRFRAEVPCEWGFLLPEQDLRRTWGMIWMARPLDLEVALRARGWPGGVSADVTFTVDDPLLGRRGWRLRVADGEADVAAAETDGCRLDVRAVGPLVTGFADPWTLRRAGLLDGPGADLAALAAAFAGPPPALRDFF